MSKREPERQISEATSIRKALEEKLKLKPLPSVIEDALLAFEDSLENKVLDKEETPVQ